MGKTFGQKDSMSPDSTFNEQVNLQENQRVVLTRNHNIRPEVIRLMIQRALDRIEVDPIPQSIKLSNIVITRDGNDNLGIECEVSYLVETENN